jgi:type III pantothenate kinase
VSTPTAPGVAPEGLELALDVGSTETTVGLFDAGALTGRWRLASDPRRTPDEAGILLRQLLAERGVAPGALRRVSYASVMPPVAATLAAASERWLGLPAVGLDAHTPLPIRVDLDEPFGVGADRIVNAVAAYLRFAADCIVVDLGTATTWECVTADGIFVGGAIAPGLRTAAEHLVGRTARLPRVAFQAPERVIGRRTEAALRSGIVFGAVDQVDGMVHRIREEWGRPDALVVATGGLAAEIAPLSRTIRFVEPDLTLHGIVAVRAHLDRLTPEAVGAPAPAPAPLPPPAPRQP